MSAPSEFQRARSLSVVRGNPESGYHPSEVDAGVKFFVLLLEKLGAETLFSCEGHELGFYVLFRQHRMSEAVLAELVDAIFGYASVEIWPERRCRFSLQPVELWVLAKGVAWTSAAKNYCLEKLAARLVARFGPVLAPGEAPGRDEESLPGVCKEKDDVECKC